MNGQTLWVAVREMGPNSIDLLLKYSQYPLLQGRYLNAVLDLRPHLGLEF